jgi:prolyl oligopeptidase
MLRAGSVSAVILLLCTTPLVAQEEDPYLWLEEVENAKALDWAGERSAADTAVLEAVPEYEEIHQQLLENLHLE